MKAISAAYQWDFRLVRARSRSATNHSARSDHRYVDTRRDHNVKMPVRVAQRSLDLAIARLRKAAAALVLPAVLRDGALGRALPAAPGAGA